MMLIVVFIFFYVVFPSIAGGIAYAAWRGIPRNFNREMWIAAFFVTMIVGGTLLVTAQRMDPFGLWQRILQEICGYSGLLLLVISLGCGISIFTHRQTAPPRRADE
jgi:hypothetical protein